MELADRDRVQAALARAQVLLDHVPILSTVSADYALDLNSIIEEVDDLLGDRRVRFGIPKRPFKRVSMGGNAILRS
jgi:hypothetical protein